jgi:hypothetical protein
MPANNANPIIRNKMLRKYLTLLVKRKSFFGFWFTPVINRIVPAAQPPDNAKVHSDRRMRIANVLRRPARMKPRLPPVFALERPDQSARLTDGTGQRRSVRLT